MVTNGLQEQATQSVAKGVMFIEKLQITRAMVFDMALFSGIGFLAGFLMRRFSTFLIAFVIFGVLLFAAQELGIIVIQFNANQLFHLLGIEVSVPLTYDVILSMVIEWLRANIVVAIAGIIGFLLGVQAG